MLRCHGEGGAGDGSDALAEGDTKLVFTTPSRESAPIWESRAYRDVLLDPGGRTFQAAYSPDGGRTSSTRVARIHKVLHDRRACRASTGDPMRHPADAASQSVERSHAGDRSGRGDSDGCATARRAWCLDCDRWRDTRGSPVRTRGDRYEHVRMNAGSCVGVDRRDEEFSGGTRPGDEFGGTGASALVETYARPLVEKGVIEAVCTEEMRVRVDLYTR